MSKYVQQNMTELERKKIKTFLELLVSPSLIQLVVNKVARKSMRIWVI